jgi:hypothetical protein
MIDGHVSLKQVTILADTDGKPAERTRKAVRRWKGIEH